MGYLTLNSIGCSPLGVYYQEIEGSGMAAIGASALLGSVKSSLSVSVFHGKKPIKEGREQSTYPKNP